MSSSDILFCFFKTKNEGVHRNSKCAHKQGSFMFTQAEQKQNKTKRIPAATNSLSSHVETSKKQSQYQRSQFTKKSPTVQWCSLFLELIKARGWSREQELSGSKALFLCFNSKINEHIPLVLSNSHPGSLV